MCVVGDWSQGMCVVGDWSQGMCVVGDWSQGMRVKGDWSQGMCVEGDWSQGMRRAHARVPSPPYTSATPSRAAPFPPNYIEQKYSC